MKNSPLDIALVSLGILIIVDSISTTYVPLLGSMFGIAMIMGYLLVSNVRYRLHEVERIRNGGTQYWIYKNKSIDWNSLIFVILFICMYSQIDEPSKYITLIMGIHYFLLFIANIILSKTSEMQLLAIEENKIINIRNTLKIWNLSKLKLIDKSISEIRLKSRWENVVLLKEDFKDNEGFIESILESLDKSTVRTKASI